MKDILLKITGKTMSSLPKGPEDMPEDSVEFLSDGKFYSRGNIHFISYEESDISGMPGCKTSLTITPKMVKLKRSGDSIGGETVMIFEEGRRCRGIYQTPMGAVEMELLTEKISKSGFEELPDGSICIDYSISLKGLFEASKKLKIEVVSNN